MAAGPQDAPRHAGQVVRRVLLRRNIAIDPETAQLVANAVQAALQPAALPATTPAPARPRRRQRAAVLTRHRSPAAGSPPGAGDNGRFRWHRDDRWPGQDHRWCQRLHGSFPNPGAAGPGSRYIPYRPDNGTWLNAAEDQPWP